VFTGSWARFSFRDADDVDVGISEWFGILDGTEETDVVSIPPVNQLRTGIIAAVSTTVTGSVAAATVPCPTTMTESQSIPIGSMSAVVIRIYLRSPS
jgi:hypothetical protein